MKVALLAESFLPHMNGVTHSLLQALRHLERRGHEALVIAPFCQTIQESLASGVPVVATGRGGPLDLVRSSVDGWLYRPGDLVELRERVRDLVGDDAKRRAFGTRARLAVQGRGWDVLGDELVAHYEDAMARRRWAAGDGRGPKHPALTRVLDDPRLRGARVG